MAFTFKTIVTHTYSITNLPHGSSSLPFVGHIVKMNKVNNRRASSNWATGCWSEVRVGYHSDPLGFTAALRWKTWESTVSQPCSPPAAWKLCFIQNAFDRSKTPPDGAVNSQGHVKCFINDCFAVRALLNFKGEWCCSIYVGPYNNNLDISASLVVLNPRRPGRILLTRPCISNWESVQCTVFHQDFVECWESQLL